MVQMKSHTEPRTHGPGGRAAFCYRTLLQTPQRTQQPFLLEARHDRKQGGLRDACTGRDIPCSLCIRSESDSEASREIDSRSNFAMKLKQMFSDREAMPSGPAEPL